MRVLQRDTHTWLEQNDEWLLQCRALAACVKGYTMMTYSIYNGWRMEDVWLDR
jgi:hypothetical protein